MPCRRPSGAPRRRRARRRPARGVTPTAVPGRSRRTARRGRAPRRATSSIAACVNAGPSGVWRAAPSSSVPISCVVVQAHLLDRLVDEQLHHVQLVGRAAARRARASASAASSSSAAGMALARQPPLDRAAAVERVAGEQQALGALEPEPVGPHRRRRRAPDARRRVADAAVLGADDQVASRARSRCRRRRRSRGPGRSPASASATAPCRCRRSATSSRRSAIGSQGRPASASRIDLGAPADVVAGAERAARRPRRRIDAHRVVGAAPRRARRAGRRSAPA